MNSRRRIAFPKAQDCADCGLTLMQLQQGFTAREIGFRAKLHSNNSRLRMSAQGLNHANFPTRRNVS